MRLEIFVEIPLGYAIVYAFTFKVLTCSFLYIDFSDRDNKLSNVEIFWRWMISIEVEV